MAAFTATKSGNWSDPTVWGQATYPQSGDTVVLPNNDPDWNITVDVDVTVGTGSGVAIQRHKGIAARLTVAAGKTLTVRGSLVVGTNDAYGGDTRLILESGASVLFDADSGQDGNLTFYSGGNGWDGQGGFAGLECRGTAEARCVIGVKPGSAQNKIRCINAYALGQQRVPFLATYTDFLGFGTESAYGIEVNAASGHATPTTAPTINNCRFIESSIALRCATAMVSFAGNTFENTPTNATVSGIQAGVYLHNFDGAFRDNVFDKYVLLGTVSFGEVDHVVFGGGYSASGAGTRSWTLLRDSYIAATDRAFYGPVRNVYGCIEAVQNNPHFFTPAPDTTVEDCVFDAPQVDITTDGGDVVLPSGGTVVVQRNLLLPVADGPSAGYASGVLVSLQGSAGTVVNIRHNTAVGCDPAGSVPLSGSLVRYGETYLGHAGIIGDCRDNLVANLHPTLVNGYKIAIQSGGSVADGCAAANAHHNAGWRLGTGSRGKGYNYPGTGTPGSSDVDDAEMGASGPDFVDPTRNLVTWGLYKDPDLYDGLSTYSEKIAAAKGLLAADTALIDDLMSWVKDGFRPRNPALEAASDNDPATTAGWIGALAGADPAPEPLTAGDITAGTPTQTTVAITSELATGGTSPYSYSLEIAPDDEGAPGDYLQIGDTLTTPTPPAWNATGLVADTTYWFRVQVEDSAGTPATDYSDAISVTTAAEEPEGDYTLEGPASGEVARAATFTVTPNAAFTGTITPADGLSGAAAGTFEPTSLAWSGTSEAKTFTYTPPLIGERTISTTNSGTLTDPAGVAFTGLMQTGNARCFFRGDPGFDPDDYHTPDLGGYELCPTGPLSEFTRPVDADPLHPRSADMMAIYQPGGVMATAVIAPDLMNYPGGGMPLAVVSSAQPMVPVVLYGGADEGAPSWSDPGPYPIPDNAGVQGWTGADPPTESWPGDTHVIVFDRDSQLSYEGYHCWRDPVTGWHFGNGAIWDMAHGGGGCRLQDTVTWLDIPGYTHYCAPGTIRFMGFQCTTAAGLPLFPLSARYDEFLRGEIKHAIGVTLPNGKIAGTCVWPARNIAWSNRMHLEPDDSYWGMPIPYGGRLRLKQSWYDANVTNAPPNTWGPQALVFLECFRKYGLVVTDGGSNDDRHQMQFWFIADSRWQWLDDMADIWNVPCGAFEVVNWSNDLSFSVTPDPAPLGVQRTITSHYNFRPGENPQMILFRPGDHQQVSSASWFEAGLTPEQDGKQTYTPPNGGVEKWYPYTITLGGSWDYPSGPWTITTEGVQIYDLSYRDLTPTSVRLMASWTGGVPPYTARFREYNGHEPWQAYTDLGEEIATSDTTASLNVTGLTAGTGHYYRLVVRDSANATWARSDYMLITTPASESVLVAGDLTATPLSETSIRFTWEPATGGTGPYTYHLTRARDIFGHSSGEYWVEVAQGAGLLTADAEGLTEGQAFWYRIDLTDSKAATAASGPVRAMPGAAPPAGPPPDPVGCPWVNTQLFVGCPFIRLAEQMKGS